MKKLLYGAGALLVLAVAAAFVAPALVDWNSHKAEVAALVRAATGRDVVIAGNLSVRLLPEPTLEAQDLRIEGPGARGGEHDLLQVRSMRFSIDLLPLLSQQIRSRSILLVDPVLRVDRLADGRLNWARPRGRAKPGNTPYAGAVAAFGDMTVRLDHIAVRNGTIVYHDSRDGTEARLRRVDADLSLDSLSGPFRGHGRAVAAGVPVGFDLNLGHLGPERDTPLNLTFSLAKADARGRFAGIVGRGDADMPLLSGHLHVEGRDGSLLAKTLTPEPWATLPGIFLAGPFTFEATIAADETKARLRDASLELDNNKISGDVAVARRSRGHDARLDAALTLQRVDLDTWLAARAGTSGNEHEPAAGVLREAERGLVQRLSVPTRLTGQIDISVEAIIMNHSVIRGMHLSADLDRGELAVNRAEARLPGGARLTAFGFVTDTSDGPRFDGTIEGAGDNLRGTLDWLNMDVSHVSMSRLHRWSLTGKVSGRSDSIRLDGFELDLDLLKLSGEAGVRFSGRPVVDLVLSTDHLNADAYLPHGSGSGAGTLDTAETAGAGNAAAGVSLFGPGALDRMDVELRARVGRLTYRGQTLDGVTLDAGLHRRALAIRRLAAQNFDGGEVRLSGRVSDIGADRPVKADFDFAASRPEPFLRMLGLQRPNDPRAAGPLTASGRLTHDPGVRKWSLDGRFSLGKMGTTIVANGSYDASEPRPAVKAKVQAGSVNLDTLVEMLPRLHRSASRAPGAARAALTRTTAADGGPKQAAASLLDGVVIPEADTDVTVSTPALRIAGRRVEEATMTVRSGEGFVELKRLDGRLYGGALHAEGRLGVAKEGGLEASVKASLDNAVSDEALSLGDLRVQGGHVSLTVALSAKGRNGPQLLDNLSGDGHLSAKGGAVRGFDLAEANRRLAARGAGTSVVNVLFHSMSSGKTAFKSLEGRFHVDQGIITAREATLVASGARGDIGGNVDLAHKRLDVEAHFVFDALPKAPPLSMRVSGDLEAPRTVLEFRSLQQWLQNASHGKGGPPGSRTGPADN